MGAWGPAIFSDDVACDIRGDYRELLEDGVPDDEASARVIEAYAHLDEDEAHVLWLALAAAQAALGRLNDSVRGRALAVIDEGTGLELWAEAGPKELAKRKAALAKLRDTLTGPQKRRSIVRKPWAHATDLVPGDVLAFRLPDERLALFRVARLDQQRVGTAPILRRLDWAEPPSSSRARRGAQTHDRRGFVLADEHETSSIWTCSIANAHVGQAPCHDVPARRRSGSVYRL